jgi:hypothetical protein
MSLKVNPVVFKRVVFFAAGLIIGLRPLSDPDIGWHLAGGLWMLDHRQILHTDVLAAGGHKWVTYSWLFEVLIAVIFRSYGFRGLLVTQAFLVGLCFAVLSWAVDLSFGKEEPKGMRRFLPVVLSGFVLLFASPICHLRPQIISFIFLVIEVSFLLTGRISTLQCFILTVIWANVHVYWIFSPFIFIFLSGLNLRRSSCIVGSVLLFMAGLASPYFFQNYDILIQYALNHSTAYNLITEFQPASGKQGFVFAIFVAISVLIAIKCREASRRSNQALTLIYVIFSAASFLQIKYLPVAGCLGVMLFCRSITTGFPAPEPRPALAEIAFYFIFLLSVCVVPLKEQILPSYSDLLKATRVLIEAGEPTGGTILNHFNSGGWIELGLYLAASSSSSGYVSYKPWLDGRTLVMGERRLMEFDLMRRSPGNSCKFVRKNKFSAAVLGVPIDYSNALVKSCLSGCRQVYKGRYWDVYLPTLSEKCELESNNN